MNKNLIVAKDLNAEMKSAQCLCLQSEKLAQKTLTVNKILNAFLKSAQCHLKC